MRGLAALETQFGYVVNLDAYHFTGDQQKSMWMPVMVAGVWHHPKFGEVPVTPDDIARMFDNFKSAKHPLANVELPVDYEHLSMRPDRKPGDGEAAGWFKDLEIRNAGTELWALVDFTDDAAKKVREKKYRYFSPSFHPNWKCIADGAMLGVTMLGGALTNYPTLPLPALTFSSEPLPIEIATRKVQTMKTIKIKDKDGKDVEIPVEGITLDALADVPVVADLRSKVPTGEVISMTQFKQVQDQVTLLSSTVDQLKAQNETYKTQAADAKKAATVAEIDALISQGKALPAEKDELIEMSTSAPTVYDKMIARRKAADPIIKLDTQHGSGHQPSPNSAVTKFDTMVEEARSKDPKLGYAEAMKQVAAKNPDLARQRTIELSIPIGPHGQPMGSV